ncbi:restriction endonuclease subunit S [Brasilonema bromeliae]|uniref:Type I restriction modification DNA specificity domain-containing protein n=1 Tax=Brasilonema bromeliae SPC951 TaxID=385972 RepID=A0ABX1P3R6_9CYAN|nr:restriction endonuclease subunit S [Brasilonema bromeliae]NMG18981.1 hypothetical protein [Brasilonema bromeliae SPC951]
MREVLVKVEEFKDSSLGKIPKDWETVTLKDEINLLHGYAFEGKYFSDRPPGEVLLVPGNFHREGGLYFDENNTKYYQGTIPNNTVLNNGDLLIVMTDLSPRTLILGRVVQLELPFKVLHNQRIGKIIPKLPDTWDKRFLMLVMNSHRVRRNIISNATGTTVRHTSPDRITTNVVPKPSRQEQSKIAEILDTVDDAIAHTSSLITKLKQIKAGLLHDLLTRGLDENGQLRDPEAHPEEFKDSALGRIPKEWEVHPLQNFTLSSAFGPRFSANAYDEKGNIATLRTTDMDDEGNLNLSTMPLAKLSLDNYSLHFLEVGDLLVSRSGTCGITSVFLGFDIPVLPGAFLIRFRLKNGLLAEFVRRYFNWDIGRERVLREAEGGVQKNLRGSTLLKLLIPVPPEIEQREILRVLDVKELCILKEEAYLKKLKLQKQGLMHDLLTGKVRVNC